MQPSCGFGFGYHSHTVFRFLWPSSAPGADCVRSSGVSSGEFNLFLRRPSRWLRGLCCFQPLFSSDCSIFAARRRRRLLLRCLMSKLSTEAEASSATMFGGVISVACNAIAHSVIAGTDGFPTILILNLLHWHCCSKRLFLYSATAAPTTPYRTTHRIYHHYTRQRGRADVRQR